MSDDREYYLESPFIDVTFYGKPDYWQYIKYAWITSMLSVMALYVYLYAIVMPDVFGFQAALLAGIAFLTLLEMGDVDE